MSSLKNAPDIMGEALGRLPIRPRPGAGKVVEMPAEANARARRLLEKVRTMRLKGMAEALEEQLESPPGVSAPVVGQLERMVAREESARARRRLHRRLKKAGLAEQATVREIDYSHARNLDPGQVARLARSGWVGQGQNLIITGPIGAGKTYLASALTRAACEQGFSARYFRLPDFLDELSRARAQDDAAKFEAELNKTDLLTLDDWGLERLDPRQALDLLRITEERYGKKAILVASLLPVGDWGQVMENSPVGAAVIDRLQAHALQVNLRGDSLRREFSPLKGSADQGPVPG